MRISKSRGVRLAIVGAAVLTAVGGSAALATTASAHDKAGCRTEVKLWKEPIDDTFAVFTTTTKVCGSGKAATRTPQDAKIEFREVDKKTGKKVWVLGAEALVELTNGEGANLICPGSFRNPADPKQVVTC